MHKCNKRHAQHAHTPTHIRHNGRRLENFAQCKQMGHSSDFSTRPANEKLKLCPNQKLAQQEMN